MYRARTYRRAAGIGHQGCPLRLIIQPLLCQYTINIVRLRDCKNFTFAEHSIHLFERNAFGLGIHYVQSVSMENNVHKHLPTEINENETACAIEPMHRV
jgi:hypothetical protein